MGDLYDGDGTGDRGWEGDLSDNGDWPPANLIKVKDLFKENLPTTLGVSWPIYRHSPYLEQYIVVLLWQWRMRYNSTVRMSCYQVFNINGFRGHNSRPMASPCEDLL